MNMALNYVAEQAGQKYDNKGKLAKTGKLNKQLYEKLNQLPYYYQSFPKSLGREWFESAMQPVLAQTTSTIPDILATLTEHIACQISKNLGQAPSGKILVTGGGTYNDYFMERLRDMAPTRVVVPSSELVDFKEALFCLSWNALLRKPNQHSGFGNRGPCRQYWGHASPSIKKLFSCLKQKGSCKRLNNHFLMQQQSLKIIYSCAGKITY